MPSVLSKPSTAQYIRECVKYIKDNLSKMHLKQGEIHILPNHKWLLKHFDTTDILSKHNYNKGVQTLTPYLIIRVMRLIRLRVPDLEVISVGSGSGKLERVMQCCHSLYDNTNGKTHNNNILCVDPNPHSFLNQHEPKIYLKPEFSTVQDLIDKLGMKAMGQILFLNWCEPNGSTYDYDAIIALQPSIIVSVFEIFDDESGAAGGEKFHAWKQNIYKGNDPVYTEEKVIYSFNSDLSICLSIIRKRSTTRLYLEGLPDKVEPMIHIQSACCIM